MAAKGKSKLTFNLAACVVPTVWCGEAAHAPKSSDPLVKYARAGTRYECLKAGIGVGAATERKKHLPSTSLQQIKYIGVKHEEQLIAAGINTTTALRSWAMARTSAQISLQLQTILKRGTALDRRAYNNVLLYLYRNGVGHLPTCLKVAAP